MVLAEKFLFFPASVLTFFKNTLDAVPVIFTRMQVYVYIVMQLATAETNYELPETPLRGIH